MWQNDTKTKRKDHRIMVHLVLQSMVMHALEQNVKWDGF